MSQCLGLLLNAGDDGVTWAHYPCATTVPAERAAIDTYAAISAASGVSAGPSYLIPPLSASEASAIGASVVGLFALAFVMGQVINFTWRGGR